MTSAPLAQHPCQRLCSWGPDGTQTDGVLPRFACRSCGSQWDRSQVWTPCDLDGTVPDEVRAEAARR